MRAQDIAAHNIVKIAESGVVLAILSGFQDKASALKLRDDLRRVADQLRSKDKDVLILMDVSRTTDHAKETEPIYIEFLQNTPYDALAAYGVGERKYAFALQLAEQSGQAHHFKAFSDEREATRWLASYLVTPARKRR